MKEERSVSFLALKLRNVGIFESPLASIGSQVRTADCAVGKPTTVVDWRWPYTCPFHINVVQFCATVGKKLESQR